MYSCDVTLHAWVLATTLGSLRERDDNCLRVRWGHETATSDFNLATQAAVIDFVGGGGCERVAYLRTAPFENWKGSPPPPNVDSYSFYSGPTFGYLAFFENRKTGMWVIKSFKKNSNFDGFFPFAGLLKGKT